MRAAVAIADQAMDEVVAHVVPLASPAKPVLAMGAWFKNTLCVTSGRQALVSRTVGDLDTPEACREHEAQARALLAMADKPLVIAHDLHPDFHSTRFAATLAAELGVPLVGVQHHHAHIAAVCAEHGFGGPVIGLALDGVGLGTDGTPWGGELLHVDGADFQRLGHLHPLALPGSDRAAREPWRMAAAVLHELGRGGEIAARFADEPAAATVAAMLERDLNCPRTSSMGRLFDAAAGLLGICNKMQFEAQAAIALEKLAAGHGPVAPLAGGYVLTSSPSMGEGRGEGVSVAINSLSPTPLPRGARGGLRLDFFPLLAALADCRDAAHGAALFHATLAAGLADWAGRASAERVVNTVALGGGCFLNKVLSQALVPALNGLGLQELTAGRLAPGDSAISLGQAWIAMHQLEKGN
jgi:hydrogenase maturation protein HypF